MRRVVRVSFTLCIVASFAICVAGGIFLLTGKRHQRFAVVEWRGTLWWVGVRERQLSVNDEPQHLRTQERLAPLERAALGELARLDDQRRALEQFWDHARYVTPRQDYDRVRLEIQAEMIAAQYRLQAVRNSMRGTPPVEYAVPLAAVVTFAGMPPAAWAALAVAGWSARRRLNRNGFCAACGYDLRASPLRCPECGAVRRNAS